VGALASALAFRVEAGGRPAPPALLSTKSCFGHTEGTAGLTGAGRLCSTALATGRFDRYAHTAKWETRVGYRLCLLSRMCNSPAKPAQDPSVIAVNILQSQP